MWSLPLQSPHTGDTGNGIILAGQPGINQSGQFVELKYTCVCVVRTLEELREKMNGARMYGHTESVTMTNEAIFTSIINNKNSLNDTIFIHIKLTPTSSLCDMTIRSQSNQICEYIKNSIITIIT